MAETPPNSRKRKRLLVASVGVATVSFLALQTGCEDEVEYMHTVANLLAPPDFGTAVDAAVDASASDAMADALPTSGNLISPIGEIPRYDSGTSIATSGNLIPVPGDAALNAAQDAAQDAQAKDAKADGASGRKD